jgi:DNA repair exonuclease SbcCD nuclease subunit
MGHIIPLFDLFIGKMNIIKTNILFTLNMSNLLCIGDIHIKPNNTHLVDLLEQQVVNYIQSKSIDMVVLLGDILDTFERLHTQTLNRAYQLVHPIRKYCPIAILVGNHDYINNQQFLTDQHWMNAMKDWKNVYVVDRTFQYEIGSKRFVFVPYVPPRRFIEALDVIPDWKTADCIFAHQEFKGCKMGAIVSSDGDEWSMDYPMVVSGHIHDHQRPQDNIYYIGASIQNSFGDQTSPRLLWITSTTAELVYTELDLLLPKKKTIYASVDQLPVQQIERDLQTPDTDMVRIVVKCDYEQFKIFTKTQQYENLVQHAKCKIVHKPLPASSNPSNDHTFTESLHSSFEQLLLDKVLFSKNEYVYSAYQKVVHDKEVSPIDILIV